VRRNGRGGCWAFHSLIKALIQRQHEHLIREARDVCELIDKLRGRGFTIFLTAHRLEEAERLCDRVAILSTTLRRIGRPDELRDQLFAYWARGTR
jgi:ABC-type nitrate/sulfonate/bicarbonate transport system ATPase subunit